MGNGESSVYKKRHVKINTFYVSMVLHQLKCIYNIRPHGTGLLV